MDWNGKKVISIAGGKGGVGKSCFAANLGLLLARQGRQTLLVDADMGGANLHTIVGIRYANLTLDDFLQGRKKSLEDVLLSTPFPGLRLLSSANDILGLEGPNFRDRTKLLQAISKVDSEIIIFDIAAGSHSRAIDFFSLAPLGIVILEPTPTSLENAFSFLKNLVYRTLLRIFYHDRENREYLITMSDPRHSGRYVPMSEIINELEQRAPAKIAGIRKFFDQDSMRISTVLNRVRQRSQVQIAENFIRIVKRYLTLTVTVAGDLPFDSHMDEVIVKRVPLVEAYPQCEYVSALGKIIECMSLS